MADKYDIVQHEELGPDGFVVRDAVPTSDVIRIRFADIDGLRALAIVIVAACVIARFTQHGLPPFAQGIASTGGLGFCLFLVLSGFALAFPPMAVLRQDGRTYLDVGRYAIRRILRIYPAYVVALALSAVVAPIAAKSGLAGFANVSPGSVVANLFFVGDGFGNDGFRALALFARAYVLFPALVWLWSRKPAAFIGLAFGFAALDLTTHAHAWSVGAFVPFMLGIIAADIRAQSNSVGRYAPILGAAAVALAVLGEPILKTLPGVRNAPGALAIDPFWSLAAFALVVSVAAYRPLERLFSFWMFRVVGASSYAASLVLVPIVGFLAAFMPKYSAAMAGPLSLGAGFILWQVVDRWFSDGTFRRNAASESAGPLDSLLAKFRADRVFLGEPSADESDAAPASDHQEEFVPNFYAPPPRPTVADLAIVSRRTGSPEELAAEILETKSRLQQRSNEIFSNGSIPGGPVYPKPGFYRKQAKETNLPFEDVDDPFAPAAAMPPPEPPTHANGNGMSQAIRIRIGATADGARNG